VSYDPSSATDPNRRQRQLRNQPLCKSREASLVHQGRTTRMSLRVDNANQPGSPTWNRTKYEYDDNGNVTADGTHTYGYSDANRLVTVDGVGALYDYDGENRRVRKGGTQTTYFFYDPSGRILTELRIDSEVNGGAAYGKDYVYLSDGPIARVDWSDTPNPDYHPCNPKPGVICPPPRVAIADLLYYHDDHLGTPIAMTNQDAELVWRAEYRPFGELFSNTIANVENNLRFPGQYFDAETGLHQNWFRDYQPKTGRYGEADPIGLVAGTNPYAYVDNGPTNLFDPPGLSPEGAVLNLIDLWKWIGGRGHSHNYGPEHPITQDLQRTPAMEDLRRELRNNNCVTGRYGGEYQYTELVTSDTIVGQTVGGFSANVTNNGSTITVDAWNYWGLESGTRLPKFPGQPSNRQNLSIQQMIQNGDIVLEWPKSILENRNSGRFKTVRTDYHWTEANPCQCGN